MGRRQARLTAEIIGAFTKPIGELNTVIQTVFIILKLVGAIGWSWWWVLTPLWVGLILTLIVLTVIALVWLITKD